MPTVQNTSQGGNGSGTTGVLSWTHTVNTASNLLVVGVHGSNNQGVSSVTYNSVNMTHVPSAYATSGSTGVDQVSDLWYMLNPPTGSADTITITMAGASLLAGTAIDYSNAASSGTFGTPGTTIAQSGSPQSSTTSGGAATDIIHSIVTWRAANTPTYSTGTIQVSDTTNSASNQYGMAGTQSGGTGTQTQTWADASASQVAISSVGIADAGGAAPGPATIPIWV